MLNKLKNFEIDWERLGNSFVIVIFSILFISGAIALIVLMILILVFTKGLLLLLLIPVGLVYYFYDDLGL